MNTNNSTKSNVQLSPSLSQQQPGTVTVRPSFKVDFNCNEKADGFYTIGQCRNDYVRCVHKTAYLQECPENYVFDSDICEYMDECHKTVQLLTNGQQEVQTPMSQAQPAIAPASSSQTYTLKQAQQRAITETQQAYNPSPQSKQIIQQNMPSQSSSLYNNTQYTSLQQQQPQGQNVAVKPELERAYGQSSRNPEGSQPQQNPPVPLAPKDTYCQDKGLVHGYHSPGCTNYFFACFSRETIRVQCPDNLFYDIESAICDYKANVPACGGIRPTSPSAQQQPQSYPTYVQQNVPAQPPPTVQEQSLQSYGQQQVHSGVQQTQPSYVQQPSQPQQPLFSSQHQQNDVQKSATLHSYVQNSGANQLQTQTEQPNIQNYVQQLPAIATFPSSNSYLYSEKQQQQQQVQQNQPIQQATQPPPQYQQQQQFNQLPQTASQSVHTYNNAQQQQATSQAQLQNSKTSYGHQSVQQSPPKIVETFCRDNNRHDGFNGAGCAPYFFVCALGETTRLHCPTGLYYDEESHECGLKTTITACGGHKPPAPSSAAQQQPLSQGSYGASSSSLPIQQQQPPAAPEFDCQQKQDGVYSTGCSSKYFICNQKKSKTLFCPPGTYYSASTELCDYRAHVTECGGIAPTTSRAYVYLKAFF
uniref:Chitin-binding type-2 domain-containing protein n=1 Tax=Panagrolaimus davidi TaxID=227884 RepID=A0A914QT81_9BILA